MKIKKIKKEKIMKMCWETAVFMAASAGYDLLEYTEKSDDLVFNYDTEKIEKKGVKTPILDLRVRIDINDICEKVASGKRFS